MNNPIMRYFEYEHLPQPMREISIRIYMLAHEMNVNLPEGPEKSAGLRKLLEAKDCFVRASLPPKEDKFSYALENNTSVVIKNVHSESMCATDLDRCAVHNKTDHHMRSWPQHFRDDTGHMERICRHGIGHPDPDDTMYKTRDHGCDGCCFPG